MDPTPTLRRPPRPPGALLRPPIRLPVRLAGGLEQTAGRLATHSIDMLRISVGAVFLGFGMLKFFPGASPAEGLVTRTVDALSLGVVTGQTALTLTAVMECFIGITLVTGKLLRLGLLALGGALVGIMSPLVLFAGDMFPGGMTLEAQYILKDVVLVAAGLTIAGRALGRP